MFDVCVCVCVAAAGWFFAFVCVFLIFLMVGSTAVSNWWLSYWLGQGSGVSSSSTTRTPTHICAIVA